MATTTPAPLPTPKRIAQATNNDVLDLFEEVGDDLVRRIKNYASVTDARALLDGIKFAQVAYNIASELCFGGTPYRLYGAVGKLQGQLSQASFDSDFGPSPIGGTERSSSSSDRRAQAEALVASVDVSDEAVLAAFRAVASETGGDVKLLRVALRLCPEVAPAKTPGRHQLVGKVTAAVRRLADSGVLEKASEASSDRRTTCVWREAG